MLLMLARYLLAFGFERRVGAKLGIRVELFDEHLFHAELVLNGGKLLGGDVCMHILFLLCFVDLPRFLSGIFRKEFT